MPRGDRLFCHPGVLTTSRNDLRPWLPVLLGLGEQLANEACALCSRWTF